MGRCDGDVSFKRGEEEKGKRSGIRVVRCRWPGSRKGMGDHADNVACSKATARRVGVLLQAQADVAVVITWSWDSASDKSEMAVWGDEDGLVDSGS